MLSFEDDTPITPTLGLQTLASTPSGRISPTPAPQQTPPPKGAPGAAPIPEDTPDSYH